MWFWILGSVLDYVTYVGFWEVFCPYEPPLKLHYTAKTSELKMASSKRSVTVVFAAMFLIGGALSQSSEYIIY